VTEEEAKTKWCPMTHKRVMVMYEPSQEPTAKRVFEEERSTALCIGSACMMFRFSGVKVTEGGDEHHHFFCGLAGNP